MRVQIFQIFFKPNTDGTLLPADPELFAMASAYANEFMTEQVDFTQFKHSWCACEVDPHGKPIRVLGILGMVFRPDVCVFRFTDNAAVLKLVQRCNDLMHDAYGARGTDVLIYIPANEPIEHQCPNRKEWMAAFDLKPAERWAIKVR
jgi:hypothetical protein